MKPLVKKINYKDPLFFCELLSNCPYLTLLDSSLSSNNYGRYTFIGFDPEEVYRLKGKNLFLNKKKINKDIFEALQSVINTFSLKAIPNLPPFQGGIAGYISYDFCKKTEGIANHKIDDLNFSDLVMCVYDLVIAFDNQKNQSYIFSTGYPYKGNKKRLKKARERITFVIEMLEKKSFHYHEAKAETLLWKNNWSKVQYKKAILKIKKYIFAGDIFQANLSQRFESKIDSKVNLLQLYKRVRSNLPTPFSAFLSYGNETVCSFSPERFIKVQNKDVETCPIKGTIKRGKSKNQDKKMIYKLINSKKDHAENLMIVDVLRNDLSRVCKYFSVNVSSLAELQSFSNVHHLVSRINGKLRRNSNVFDLFKAVLPGASITGAPKIRAMEIIAELEPYKRGPYCGCIGYIGFNGNVDTNIVIRTFYTNGKKIVLHAGGGIVSDSDPTQEYEESLVKVETIMKSLGQFSGIKTK